MSAGTKARFAPFTSRTAVVPQRDVDTDQIIPARYLKVTDKQGLGAALFADRPWLTAADEGAQVLVAGDNFGCGSSREHAVWALAGRGFRAVISTSFGDIFRQNCLKNGLLPIVVDAPLHARLLAGPTNVTVDLAAQTLAQGDQAATTVTFAIDAFAKKCLLEGIDELGYLMGFTSEIVRWERRKHV
jgi:3-isopropylmalate/(R)-2-methylmalate dehydratase small subunit